MKFEVFVPGWEEDLSSVEVLLKSIAIDGDSLGAALRKAIEVLEGMYPDFTWEGKQAIVRRF